ncbi:Hypothetical protein CINCED_3A010078 [Cinara cedri]|nr:Hypothetical protein CINCED_3A010078 [Cinara cedri]
MVEDKLTRICYMDNIEEDNMIRYPRQRIVDMYKKAMARIRDLETKTKEVSICSKCNNRDRTDHAYQEMLAREQCLLRKLALKEQEIQDHSEQLLVMQNSFKNESLSSLKCTLQDPAVNILIQKLRQELNVTKAKLEETQTELNTWKFTPDSNTGKRLMAKCHLLYQENEELGEIVNSGRIAKLEGELALQKTFGLEVKKSQSELDQFLQDLDDDVESMQSTIYFLQNELLKYKTSEQTTINFENKEIISKESVNNKDDIMTSESISNTEIPTSRAKQDSNLYKMHNPEDLNYPNDGISNHSTVKEFKIFSEDMNHNGNSNRLHTCKHRSGDSISGEIYKKSAKRHCSKDKCCYKKSRRYHNQSPN